MKSKLRLPGIFSGSVFLAGAILNVADEIISSKISIWVAFADFPYVISLIIISAIFFVSAYISRLSWLQPLFFLLATPFMIYIDSKAFFGLGFFVIAISLLYKLDFYEKHRVLKVVVSVLYILSIEVAIALNKGERIYQGLTPTFFIIAFLLFLFLTFRDKIIIYLKEPKVQLSLDAKGLSESEQLYVRAIIGGRTPKQVASDYGVSESTIRNTLSRAYKKLGVSSKADLNTIAERYEIVD